MRTHHRSLAAATAVLASLLAPPRAATAQTAVPAVGTIQGRVAFGGATPVRGAKLADAVVYLTGEGLAAAVPSDTAVLNQASLLFAPHVLPVMAGGPVEFRNSDAILHNAHTVSEKNRPINHAQVGHTSFTAVFRVPEPIHVGCDIHSQMSAYIVVVPNRFFTRPKADGTYAIAAVPPGTYELVAWHEKYGTVTATVVVRTGGATQADVTLSGTNDIAKHGGSQ